MSSTFYGNRRFFETKFSSLNASPCKNFQREVHPRTTTMSTPRQRSGLRRSFSLQGKSGKTLNLVKNADLSKKQSKSCKLSPYQRRGKISGVEKSTERLGMQSLLTPRLGSFTQQNSPPMSHHGSFSRQKSIDESSVSEVDYSIYVHGYCGVGKSTLVHQLPYVFSANEIFDLGREHREEIFINTNDSSFHIKEIDVLYKGTYQNADIHLVVFAMDDIVSMKYAIDRVTFLRWKCRIQSPIYIIGNNTDNMRRKPNYERDVEFITQKLDCSYLRLSDNIDDNITILKAAMDSVFTPHHDECCTTDKKNVFKNIFKCLFSWKKH